MSWVSTEGSSSPLGVTYIEEDDAYNFALYSKHGEEVALFLFREDEISQPAFIFYFDPLCNRSGRTWHCRISRLDLAGIHYYAYSVDGSEHAWHAFDKEKQLLDPYARAIHVPKEFDRMAATVPGSNMGRAMLACIGPVSTGASGARPKPLARHEANLVIYELHVRGYTCHPSSPVPQAHRGTFSGLADMIPYLCELGITAVELMPVFQHDPSSGDYWGYSPMSFFAPHLDYSRDGPEGVVAEFRNMVDAFHRADIEVILDVVYNHTAEGDHRGPIYSFKGIDNSTYYLCSEDAAQPYLDYSGVGNTLHTANRHTRQIILDSLRYWGVEMGVDGFRFDLASIFARDDLGRINSSESATPIFGEIAADPGLRKKRLIAEPWDAAGTCQLGRSFPGTQWHQWNARFRDDVRRYVRGDAGMIPALMYRLYGSDDLFSDRLPDVFHPSQGINFVTSHDGLTLCDVVSYEKKHNWANGHNNTDGPEEEFSANYGLEGTEGANPEIASLRLRQAKNLIAILMLSNGTPMLRGGDEFLQTQHGNSNPYDQDNETSWIDWSLRQTNHEMFRFVREAIAFRKRHPSLCRSRFWREDARWFSTSGPADLSDESRQLALHIDGSSQEDQKIYAMFNMSTHDIIFEIQVGEPSDWMPVIDTARASPGDIRDEQTAPPLQHREYQVGARSVVALVSSGMRCGA